MSNQRENSRTVTRIPEPTWEEDFWTVVAELEYMKEAVRLLANQLARLGRRPKLPSRSQPH